MRKWSYALLLTMLFSSCKNETKIGKFSEKDFFDLNAFVDEEINLFKSKNCSVYKEGEINLEDDAINVDVKDFNWDKEFKILSDFNIKKTAWYDYFQIDTIEASLDGMGDVITIRYTTESTNIPIKSLKISYLPTDFQQPVLIEGERKVKNWIFHTEQKIYYTGSAMRVEGYQKILWLEEKNFNITTIYNCHNESN